MPNYLKLPDGTYFTVPDGVDPDMAMAMAKDKYPDAFKVNNSEHILFRCGDKYKTSDDSSTAAKLRGEGCIQITGLQQSTPVPTATSSPIAVQNSLKLQDVNWGSAAGTALLQTAGGFAVASLLFWVLTRHLWKKLRRTPHELGLWVGSWFACSSVGLYFVPFLIGDILYKLPNSIDWEKYFIGGPAVTVAYFLVGYVLGWLFRKVKPLASPVQTVVPTSPSRDAAANAINSVSRSHVLRAQPDASSPPAVPKTSYLPTERSDSNAEAPPTEVDAASPLPTPNVDDEALYEQALNELSTSKKPGLWAMALAQTANGGNAEGTYIALRGEQLKHEYAQQKQTPKNQGVVAVPEHIDHPQSPVNQLPEIARASRLRRLEMAFNTSVESAHRGLDTCEPLAKHYKTLARFRSPVDARKLVWLIDYEILEPGEDPNFPDSYLVRRSAGDEPIAFFKDEREFVDWALTNFVVRMPEAGGYI